MKVRDTSRGRMYAVSSNPGCTVINGDMAVDVPAGGQSVILALDKKLIIDGDDDAKFVEVRWGTNAAIGGRHRDPDITTTNIPISFLQSTGAQYIDSGVPYASDTCIETIFEITQFYDSSNPALFGTENSPNHRNARFAVLLYTDRFRWDYGSEMQVESIDCKLNTKYKLKKDGPDNYMDDVLVSSNSPSDFVSDKNGLIFTRISLAGHFIGKIYSFTISRAGEMQADYVPCITPEGKLGMYNKIDGTFKENAGGGSFIAGLTMAQALNLANLPATGGSLTVSLPLEAEFDDNVNRALEAAAAKGWTIHVQYRESELTTKNIDADFLESTGQQWLDLGEFDSSTLGMQVDLETVGTISWAVLGGILCGNGETYGVMIRSRYGIGYQCGRSAFYPLTTGGTAATSSDIGGNGYLPKGRFKVECNWLNNRKWLLSPDNVERALTANIYPEINKIGLFARYYALRTSFSDPETVRIFKAEVSQEEQIARVLIPALDPSGVPCMYDTASDQNFYNANTSEGATPFIVGFDTTEKAAISISKLPVTTGGTLTVSLPAEAEDETTRVPEACRIAATRGWTIFPQYRTN